jgi:hypothetical protein
VGAAVAIAFELSVTGAVVDMRIGSSLSLLFDGAYIAGCLTAVLVGSRAALLALMTEPPVVALAACAVAALTGGAAGASAVVVATGLRVAALFPLMAAVTAATTVIGLLRLWWRRSLRPAAPARQGSPRSPYSITSHTGSRRR